MADKTLKGQEVYVNIVANGALQARIDSIRTAEVTFRFEVKEKQYLGETAPRFDTIFMGVQVKIDGDLTNPQFFQLVDTIARRARRELGPGTRFDIGITLRFDNGQLGNFIFTGLEFSDVPFNTGGRDEDSEWSLDGMCSNFTYVG